MPKRWLFWYLLIVASFARAEASSTTTPGDAVANTRAFWGYFIEYGGDQNELFDPADLADIERSEVQQAGMQKPTSRITDDDNGEQQP